MNIFWLPAGGLAGPSDPIASLRWWYSSFVTGFLFFFRHRKKKQERCHRSGSVDDGLGALPPTPPPKINSMLSRQRLLPALPCRPGDTVLTRRVGCRYPYSRVLMATAFFFGKAVPDLDLCCIRPQSFHFSHLLCHRLWHVALGPQGRAESSRWRDGLPFAFGGGPGGKTPRSSSTHRKGGGFFVSFWPLKKESPSGEEYKRVPLRACPKSTIAFPAMKNQKPVPAFPVGTF